MAINSANFVRVRIGGVCQDRQGEWEGEGREGRRWEGVKERGERERGGGEELGYVPTCTYIQLLYVTSLL